MDYNQNISISDLKVKRKELEDQIDQATKAIAHIDYVFQNFLKQGVPIRNRKNEKSHRQVILDIFKSNPFIDLQNKIVIQKIKEAGHEIGDATFYAYLNKLAKEKVIKSMSRGVYRYEPY